ncbi:nucleotide-binding universal stress UspA family protein [Kineococcus radiotolerans]|uniref:UspA domain protein n=2 Tax=Kineococcus radiotolerans TaxID=131568 RepID=A6W421_KINRD|nr:universal stress protein [Kineococcus radiotolerans]ABS01560.1 UspA domain protein [Kineococcus radiotolerans SRS30216 = ATCC BAA-149]MBB2901313.1 nucleotide-binding universal stress UspA family protein [Kineococcus radiotolerans]
MTILVGYTPTPAGDAALTFALDESDRRGEPLHVLNTSRGDKVVDPRYADEEGWAQVRARLEEAGVEFHLDRRIDDRDPAEALLATAEDVAASAIVIGIRRRSPTGKLIFGSEAQTVLLEADCPVLAVKAPRT